jgi:hypothetical protein
VHIGIASASEQTPKLIHFFNLCASVVLRFHVLIELDGLDSFRDELGAPTWPGLRLHGAACLCTPCGQL